MQDDLQIIGQSPPPVHADVPYQTAEGKCRDEPHLSSVQRLSHVLKGKLGQQFKVRSPGQQAYAAALPREALLPKKPTGLAELLNKLSRLSGPPQAKHAGTQSEHARTGGSNSTAQSARGVDQVHLAGTGSLGAPVCTPSGVHDCTALACPTAGPSGQPEGNSQRCSADREATSTQAAPRGFSGRPSPDGKHESEPGVWSNREASREEAADVGRMHPLLAAASRLAEEAAGHSSGDQESEAAWKKLAAIRSICQAGLAGVLLNLFVTCRIDHSRCTLPCMPMLIDDNVGASTLVVVWQRKLQTSLLYSGSL